MKEIYSSSGILRKVPGILPFDLLEAAAIELEWPYPSDKNLNQRDISFGALADCPVCTKGFTIHAKRLIVLPMEWGQCEVRCEGGCAPAKIEEVIRQRASSRLAEAA